MTRGRALALTLAAPVCWSIGGPLVRLVEAEPWTIVFLRSGSMSLVVLLAMLLLYRARTPHKFLAIGLPGWLAGSLMGSTFALFVFALQHTSVAHVIVLADVAPLLAALVAWLWLGERVKARTWLCLIVALLGAVAMVAGKGGGASLLGDGLAALVALLFAFYIVLLRRYRAIDLLPATLVAGVVASIPAAFMAPALWVAPADGLLFALLSGLALGSGALLFTAGAAHLPPAESGLIVLLEVVLAAFWAWLVLGEQPSGPELAGGVAVLAALVANQLMPRAVAAAPSA